MTEHLHVDGLDLDVTRSERSDIEIIVDRDGSLRVHSPVGLPIEEISRAVRRREDWIYRKLAQKRTLLASWRIPDYRLGESIPYLGRNYRLTYVEEAPAPVRLIGGWFELLRSDKSDAADRFRDWYQSRGREWLPRRVARVSPRLGIHTRSVVVRDLGYRWASCGVRGIAFSWRVMQLPPAIIDYVILHELAHLLEPRHSRAFWVALAKAMPDYQQRQLWLAERGRHGLSVA
jgi:predicted metal-dependent hydrolase